MQPISTATGAIAAMAMTLLVSTSSDAAIITRTYDIEAAGFAPVFGSSTPAPTDPVHISVMVTFDNAADITDETAGITLKSSNLALSSTFGFTYLMAIDSIFFGGIQSAVGGTVGFSDDFVAFFNAASTDAPEFVLLFYTIASSGEAWLSWTGSTTVRTEVPEPAALALLPFGLVLLGGAARRGGAPQAA